MLPRHRLPRRIGAREVAALAVLALPIAMAGPTTAQPSPEQIDTIRQACRSDYIAHCSSVQPGGREALQCLERNAAQLSTECGSAVSAAVPKAETRPEATPESPQPAAAAVPQPSPQDQLAAVQQACTVKDFMSHCSWIAPSNPELVLCLRANAGELSPACQNVVRATAAAATPSAVAPPPMTAPSIPAPPAAAAVTPVPPPVPAAPRAATAPKQPSPQQINAIRAACRSDFISYCTGVRPGGRDALLCLERNKAGASQSCQSALAAIGGGPASPDATTPAAATPAATPPPAATDQILIRRLPLRAEIAILRVCAADHRIFCDGIPPGGGRIIACLARNASRLGPECRAVLAAAARG
jgi:hypothetical protein